MAKDLIRDGNLTIRAHSDLIDWVAAFSDELGISRSDLLALIIENAKTNTDLIERIRVRVRDWWKA